MADTKVILGDFEFGAYEVPESIPFGGAQRLVTHKLPGGARVVQSMGRDDAPLAWSGLFLGAEANARAQYLDSLRIAGKPLKLTWADLAYTVVIEDYRANFERFYKIPYAISCLVVSDDANPLPFFPALSYDAAIMGDNTTAQALGAQLGDGPLSALLATMDTAIRSVSTFANQAQTVINGILAPVAAVQQRVQLLIATTTNTLGNIGTLGGLIPNSSVAQAANRVTSQLSSATQLPALQQLQSVTGRITTNLNIVSGAGPATRTATVAGGTFLDVAAAKFGDALRGFDIMRANNTTDTNISGTKTITLPPQ